MEISATARAKRDARIARWLDAEGVAFKNEAAKEKYNACIQRFVDALKLEKTPDRVPLYPLTTFMQTDLYDVTPGEAMYDYQKLLDTHKRYTLEYDPDFYGSPAPVGSGKIFDTLGLKFYTWPRGGGLKDTLGYQCLEDEYMKAEDYQWLIDDPSDFWLRKYIPQMFEKLSPLAHMGPVTGLWEIVGMSPWFIPFGVPPVQDALKAIIEAGTEAMNWISQIGAFEAEIKSYGYPCVFGGATKAPFDVLADLMRGTRGIMFDMYRCPDKLIEAMERLVPIFTAQGVSMADMANNPIVFMPLHKGADGFMSDEQYKKFYWPTFKQVIMNLVEEGCIPYLFAEGGYNSRLEYIKELPKGSCFWIFDHTDMATAKKEVGEHICIGGNVPADLLMTGTPDEVDAYCKNLMDTCKPGGGYLMAFGTGMDEGRPEMVKAMYEATKKYGVY